MAREDLQITITAVDKATGTFKGLAQTVGNVQKGVEGLNETARNLNWMFLGQDLLRATRVGVTGLASLAKATSDVVESQNFVEQVFGDSSDAIESWAKVATKSTLMSENAILQASATFGVFGKSAGVAGDDLVGFSKNLVQLAADMASVKNTSVDQAINAIGAAFRNEFTPIRQYGAALDEATLKAEALKLGIYDGTGTLSTQQRVLAVNQLLYEQLGFAIGDVARTADTFANKQRLLGAQFENFKASLGDTLMPIFNDVMGAAQGLMSTFSKLPDPVQNFAVRAAAAGTALLGLAGGMVYIAGKGGQALAAFRDLSASMRDIRQNGTGAQKAMMGIGTTAAGLAAAAAASQLIFSTINDVRDVAGKTTTAIKQMNVAIAEGNRGEAWSGFLDLAKQKDDVLSFGHLITDFGKKVQLVGSDTKRPIEDLDAAFKELLNQDPGNAATVLDIMREQAGALDKNSGQYKDNMSLIQRWSGMLSLTTKDLAAQGKETGLTAEQIQKYGGELAGATEEQKSFDKGVQEAAEQMQEWRDEMIKVDTSMGSLADRTDDFSTAIDDAFNDEWLNNFIEGKDTVKDLTDALKDSDKAVRTGAQGLDLNTESGREAVSTLNDLRETIGKDMVRAYKDAGGSVDAAKQSMEDWKGVVADQMKQAGVSQPIIDKYIDALNLTDGTFESIIRLSGQEEARRKLDELNIEYQKLPPAIYTKVQAAIDAGDYQTAYQLMKEFLETPIDTPVDTTGEEKAGQDAHNTVKDAVSEPVTQPVTTKDTNSRDVKRDIVNWFLPPAWQAVNTKNDDRNTTKGWFNNLFGLPVNQPVTTSNGDRSNTKSIIAGVFGNPVNQTITTSNSDAGRTKSNIASNFATPITQYVQAVFKGAVGVPPGAAAPGVGGTSAGRAAAPSAAEYSATALPQTGLMATTAAFVPAPVAAGVMAPSSTPAVINLSVNMPTGTNEARVVDLLRSYTRSNGRAQLRGFN